MHLGPVALSMCATVAARRGYVVTPQLARLLEVSLADVAYPRTRRESMKIPSWAPAWEPRFLDAVEDAFTEWESFYWFRRTPFLLG